MKIEKIIKTNNGKYKVELDNKEKIVTYDDVIINNNLLYKKEIDSEILNKINNDTSYYNIYNKVIKYINIRLRSEKEINLYLDKIGVKEEKENIIKNLKKDNMINDRVFSRSYINDKFNFSNYGINKIRKDLLEHNINEEVIEEELLIITNGDIINKLRKYVLKKSKVNKKSLYLFKQKMINELINLGYDLDDINLVLSEIKQNDDVLEKNYNIIYNKLSKKYEDEELIFKVKQKLFQKGFNKDEIEEYIKKRNF